MRLSELLQHEVRDGNNRVLGVVRDIRATVEQEEDGRWRAVRIDTLLVAPRWRVWARAKRPLLFEWLDRRFDRTSRTISFDAVVSIEPDVIRVRASE